MSENTKDDGGTAYPNQDDTIRGGMNLRDYFAAAALTGLLSNPQGYELPQGWSVKAYQIADAMLAARDKREK